ncbi:hypothetical protein Trydic_g5930 [Trypoxylus dichotomus]
MDLFYTVPLISRLCKRNSLTVYKMPGICYWDLPLLNVTRSESPTKIREKGRREIEQEEELAETRAATTKAMKILKTIKEVSLRDQIRSKVIREDLKIQNSTVY